MIKSLRRWLIFILLVISVSLNFYLCKQVENQGLRLNYQSLNPVYLKRYPVGNDPSISPKSKVRVVFFGDSRSQQWVTPRVSNFEFINRGIGGETSGQSYLRFRDHVSYLEPDIIVIQLGVNDLRMKPLPTGSYQEIIENCQENILKIIQEAQQINAKVIVTPIFPLGEGTIPVQWRLSWVTLQDLETGINAVNQFIRSLDKLENVSILEIDPLLQDNQKIKPQYAKDLLHLNRQGYEVLNQILIPKL